MGKKEAFERNGAEFRNIRWSWAGKAPDDSLVVLTFWKDKLIFDKETKSYRYDDRARPTDDDVNANGNLERKEYIRLALDKLDGIVRVIVAVAEDVTARPRRAIDTYALPGLRMRIVNFDEETGEFSAESVPTGGAAPQA